MYQRRAEADKPGDVQVGRHVDDHRRGVTAAGVYLEVTAAQVVFLLLGFLAVPLFVHVRWQ
jgi:hypothetical protein